jgi:predicted HTH transcriptional regulator
MSGESPEPDYIYNERTLPEIIDEGVSEYFEFLPSIPEDEIEFAKFCTALGNHEGGVILLGVDRGGDVCGLSDADEVPIHVAEILEEHTEPVPEYSSREVSYDGESIVIINVSKYTHIPHAVTWEEELEEGEKETYYVFYKRRDIYQSQIGPYQIWRLMPENSQSSS